MGVSDAFCFFVLLAELNDQEACPFTIVSVPPCFELRLLDLESESSELLLAFFDEFRSAVRRLSMMMGWGYPEGKGAGLMI